MPPPLPSLLALIQDNYVLPHRVPRLTAALRSLDLDDQDPPDVVAAELTRALREGSDDLHLRVKVRSPGSQAAETEDFEVRMAREARAHAGGIRSVSRLDEDTAVIQIAPYLSELHLSSRYIDAAFALVADVGALVIDVRTGTGGTPSVVAYICGYLLGDEPVHLQDVVERDGTARQFWTSPQQGRLRGDVGIALLTSAQTFSGCEELAYDLQACGRAVVIGETTGGGAHPVQVFPLTEEIEVAIPVARSINATTGGNWEGCGVRPDIETAAADALDTARTILPVREAS